MYTTLKEVRRHPQRVLDEKGRATAGPQSPYELSLSLAVTAKVIRVGLSTRGVEANLFALWWSPQSVRWTELDTQLARAAFFDLAELTSDHLFPGEEEQMLQIQPQPSSASP